METVSVKEMQAREAALFKSGLNADLLMENAGRLCAQEILNDYFRPFMEEQATVFCGPGNNGGDGLVLARRLAEYRVPVVCYIIPPANGEYKELVMRNLKRAFVCHVSVKEIDNTATLKKAAAKTYVAVDALLGLGAAARAGGGLIQEVIDIINTCRNIVSIDGPTGLGMDDARPYLPRPVRANATYTLGFAKKGLTLKEAAPYTGRLRVLDIFGQVRRHCR
ncbi:MAG: NAD(P)H-hydrate epimerase [Elusimicrobiota bacterium]|jgi:NAD(P)H-hydrate epimerase|nr:NAD(P)H-hydrate epimerase [Elusimicrobiota bacterium]